MISPGIKYRLTSYTAMNRGDILSLTLLFTQLVGNPLLLAAVLLTLAVVFVNGWTDAPNAIAAAVATSALSFRRAALLGGICSLLGGLCMVGINSQVAYVIYSIADFRGEPQQSLTALCAAMASIVIWAVAAWLFGLPTSESHALAAGLTGAAVALKGSFAAVNWWAWGRLLLGLFLSVAAGFLLARIFWSILPHDSQSARLFRRLQIPAAAAHVLLPRCSGWSKVYGSISALCHTCPGKSTAGGLFHPALACTALLLHDGGGNLRGRTAYRPYPWYTPGPSGHRSRVFCGFVWYPLPFWRHGVRPTGQHYSHQGRCHLGGWFRRQPPQF